MVEGKSAGDKSVMLLLLMPLEMPFGPGDDFLPAAEVIAAVGLIQAGGSSLVSLLDHLRSAGAPRPRFLRGG